VVVITKEEEDQAPHPSMEASTAELVRRFRFELPPWQQKMLSVLVMPDRGRKAHQLNWALRPENLAAVLGDGVDASRVWVGVSDADSIPDRNAFRWIAADVVNDGGREAYQGVTLSLANFDRLGVRGRVCAVQQSSIFIRVSIARLISERRRVQWFAGLARRVPRLASLVRHCSNYVSGGRRSASGTTVRPTRYAPGPRRLSDLGSDGGLDARLCARRAGILIAPLPMLEMNDLPETTEKMVRQNARWYKGVLDDVPFLWQTWQANRTAFNAAQLVRHVGNKVVEWPIAAVVYPLIASWAGTWRTALPITRCSSCSASRSRRSRSD